MKYSSILFSIFFVFSLVPHSSAVVVWSDYFDDGNYDGWTVEFGDWRILNGAMDAYYVDESASLVWHESTQVTGTWSFDYHHFSDYETFYGLILFLANGTTVSPFNCDGYGIEFTRNSVFLIKQSGALGAQVSLGLAMFEQLAGTWTHVDVTRNLSGEMFVYLNATTTIAEPDISYVDTSFSYSEMFVALAYGPNMMRFDNVSVNSEILITPPEITTTTETTTTTTTEGTSTTTTTDETASSLFNNVILLAGAAIAGVVIIVAVVWMKKH